MNLYILNTISSGWDVCSIIHDELPVAGYIGLTAERDNKDISGYLNTKNLCQQATIPYYEVSSYTLTNNKDIKLILSLDIDVLLVSGWQRLVPDYLIEHCKICVIGAHGSPLGITEGRGRSPQNWALIMGLPNFEISIFKIDKGIDSGEIISSSKFELNAVDNIQTSYLKTSFLIAQMTIDAIKNKKLEQKGDKQDDDQAKYLPKRTFEDGLIDWNRTAEEVVNFVRALTKPYPGAFTVLGEQKLFIWEACAFENKDFLSNYKFGELIHRYITSELLIKCRDGAVIVKSYDTEIDLNIKGIIFGSANFKQQLQNIVTRHYQKYPELKVSEKLLIE